VLGGGSGVAAMAKKEQRRKGGRRRIRGRGMVASCRGPARLLRVEPMGFRSFLFYFLTPNRTAPVYFPGNPAPPQSFFLAIPYCSSPFRYCNRFSPNQLNPLHNLHRKHHSHPHHSQLDLMRIMLGPDMAEDG
jgi:hypothetical protein